MHIKVQQDNPRPHASVTHKAILEAGHSDGWNIDLACQPPNSPDFNVLDLGYFSCIQSLQHQYTPKDIDELVNVVHQSFDALSPEKLDNVFLSLQKAMESALKVKGGNNYKLAHIGKVKQRQNGALPHSIQCSPELIASTKLLIGQSFRHKIELAIELSF